MIFIGWLYRFGFLSQDRLLTVPGPAARCCGAQRIARCCAASAHGLRALAPAREAAEGFEADLTWLVWRTSDW